MNRPLVVQSERKMARPLKVLIPLMQSELQQGNAAAREHHTSAGRMLTRLGRHWRVRQDRLRRRHQDDQRFLRQ
jgi:hypothetical protein